MKYPYIVTWVTYNRDKPEWREIKNFTQCSTLDKANRAKKNLESQKAYNVKISKVI